MKKGRRKMDEVEEGWKSAKNVKKGCEKRGVNGGMKRVEQVWKC